MIYLFCGIFLIYNFLVFSYCSRTLRNQKLSWEIYIITSIINMGMFLFRISISEFRYEGLWMIIYVLVYGLEIYLFYRETYERCIFVALSFVLNLFAINWIVVGILALSSDKSIEQLMVQLDTRILISIINVLILIPYILLVQKKLHVIYLDMILMDKKNLFFANCIFITNIIYFSIIAHIWRTEIVDVYLIQTMIKIGSCSIIGYLITLYYAYVSAKLKLEVTRLDQINGSMREEELKLEKLKEQVNRDDFTGVYVRKVVEQQLKNYIDRKLSFYLIFIDLDGLKFTNDRCGHEEGDFYIKKVVGILRANFKNEMIGRMGGDEFIITGLLCDKDELSKKLIQSYTQVKQIQSVYKKKYTTSISYGIVNVDATNRLTMEELIDLADTRMYDFKKSRKLQRDTK